MTGWNLPPGCTTADIDRAAGVGEPCFVCGRDPDGDCICPECPTCGAFGDSHCYHEFLQSAGHDLCHICLKPVQEHHRKVLVRTPEQVTSRKAADEREREQEAADREAEIAAAAFDDAREDYREPPPVTFPAVDESAPLTVDAFSIGLDRPIVPESERSIEDDWLKGYAERMDPQEQKKWLEGTWPIEPPTDPKQE